MTWLVWRQHRTQAAVGAAILAAFAALLLITGLRMASQFHAYVAACTAARDCVWPAPNNIVLGSNVVGFLVEFTLAAPAVIAMFWGAPLVAREAESGTSQFVWMQSVTRRRWFAVTTGWMLLAAAVWGGAVTALVTWWSGPKNAAFLNAFNPGDFDVQGIAPAAYAVFAMALGIAAGALIRRTLPALAVTLGGYFAVRLAIMGWIRQHYMAAVTVTSDLGAQAYQPKGAAWILAQGVRTGSGAVLQQPNGAGPYPVIGGVPFTFSQVPPACRAALHPGGGPQPTDQPAVSCLTAHGYRNFITFQPADRFWAFQGIEAGIFVVLAAALIALAAIAVLRRDA
jgi:hypothetical protein